MIQPLRARSSRRVATIVSLTSRSGPLISAWSGVPR